MKSSAALTLVPALALTLCTWATAGAGPCKADGQTCSTNASCCSRVCSDSNPPGKRFKGVCGGFVANGTIVIVKDALPDDSQDFSFNLTNGSTINQNFTLDDDADPTLPNSQTFSVPPGTWTASELNIPAGWELRNLVCADPTNDTTVSPDTATATIHLTSSETVTCTFTDAPLCASGTTLCGSSCVDLGTDENNCGTCANPCGFNEECTSGTCTCIPNCTDKPCGDDGCGGSCGVCICGSPCEVEGESCGTLDLTCTSGVCWGSTCDPN